MPKKQPEIKEETYTKSQVNDIMWYALRQHDKNIWNAMESLYESEEFQAEATKENYTPLNWLYYAQDDISYRKMISVEAAWEEFDRRKELNNTAQKLIDLLSPERKAELIEKELYNAGHPQNKADLAKLREMLRRLNKGDKK